MWFFKRRKPKLTREFIRSTFEDALNVGDKVYVTPQLIADLQTDFDVSREDFEAVGILISDNPPEEDLNIVGARHLPGEDLFYPDNFITDCALGCGFKVQYRPNTPKGSRYVCTECMLDRVKDKADRS